MGMVWAALFGLVLLIAVLISRINIRVTYYRKGKDDELIIIVSALYGLVNFKSELNLLELMLKGPPGLKIRGELEPTAKGKPLKEFGTYIYAEKAFYYYRKYRGIALKHKNAVKYIKRKIYIRKLQWHTALGTGDAAATGIAIGLLWNVKTIFSTLLGAGFRLGLLPDLHITPCFDGAMFITSFDCILSIRIGHAITAGMLYLTANKKDGDAVERASD
ncbi:MAG TPA: DUF2953 domain-containing protein [Bacillota bacterium]|jgi:hypothetical protein|nr:DUF2953 domain-containing protein [Bacillota bacterium]